MMATVWWLWGRGHGDGSGMLTVEVSLMMWCKVMVEIFVLSDGGTVLV